MLLHLLQKKLIEDLVKIQHDGTVEVDVTRNVPVASELLELDALDASSGHTEDAISEACKPIPRLKIAMLVVGTRGDVQVFLAFAKRLQACILEIYLWLYQVCCLCCIRSSLY